MKSSVRTFAFSIFVSLFVTGCLSSGGTAPSQTGIMVDEVAKVCGAMVGAQAEQRINQEWSKYPEAEVSRSTIEGMTDVLLNNPAGTTPQMISEYKKYLTCATGLLMANGIVQ